MLPPSGSVALEGDWWILVHRRLGPAVARVRTTTSLGFVSNKSNKIFGAPFRGDDYLLLL